MPDVNASVILLLDTSDSMSAAMPLVIIDGKAFVRAARPNDQIAAVQFSDIASMVYPHTAVLATVDGQLSVTAAAATAIGKLVATGLTNMYAAVTIANTVLGSAVLPTRAYVLLSDGEWNSGGDPSPITPTTVPLFVCGLGPHMQQSYVAGMLAKNAASQYLPAPNAFQMGQVFNAIRGLATQADVARNVLLPYSGTDYTLTPVLVSAATDEAQLTVVWSNAALSYTANPVPDPTHVNVVLIDPAGTSTTIRPTVADPGYAIFNLVSPQPGTWQVLCQYTGQSGTFATNAGFEFDTGLSLSLDVPRLAAPGDPLTVRAHVTEAGAPVERAQVGVRWHAPRHDIEALLDQHAAAVDEHLAATSPADKASPGDEPTRRQRLDALREVVRKADPSCDVFERSSRYVRLLQGDDGSYSADLGTAPHAGDLIVEASAHAFAPAARTEFARSAMAAVAVV